MTTEQAAKRFEAEADKHRKRGDWQVGHEWQRRADEMRHLAYLAESLKTRGRAS